MPAGYAGNFAGYVDLMATNSPHATVMDWWRRLDRAVREYFLEETGESLKSRELEALIAREPNFGKDGKQLLQELRQFRNRAAHESGAVSREEAVRFAQEALQFIGALGSRRPLAECALVPVDEGTT